MNITERLKYIITEENLTLTQLNDLMNKKNGTNYTVQNLSRKLNNDNLKFNDVEDILNILGYKIVFTKINNESKEEKTLDNITTDQFSGVDLDGIVEKEFNKYIEKLIKQKAQEYFEKLFTTPPFEIDNCVNEIKISDHITKKYNTISNKEDELNNKK